MLPSKPKSAYILSAIIGILMIVASVGGLLLDKLYQDNPFVISAWYSNDLITLFVAVPVLFTALFLAMGGSQRAQLVWLGMLAYTLYNYAFYLFGAALNNFFLVYAALFTLSIFALIFGLASLDVKGIAKQFDRNTPVKWIASYILFVALFLGGFWIILSLNYVFTKEIPQILVAVDSHTNLIAALDLSIVVSFGLLGAIWLWKHKPWGYVLAVMWNVKGVVYTLVLSAGTISTVQEGATVDFLSLALWGFISIGCSIASVYLLANLNESNNGSTWQNY
ncbi:MAG: hypothetical protein QNJ41_28280 [Xenococcaceae cyanobacterium MO_188.B32]|nr:hypothetical protein [Xenococcaceae cyanobacterium MO_188.B32]